MAGSRRSLPRQRRQRGPMLAEGMPRWALTWAYDSGDSPTSRAINCWQLRGRRVNASRSAASRSAASNAGSSPAVGVCASGMLRARLHSRRVVAASQLATAVGSRSSLRWSASWSQTARPTSSASAPSSWYRRQIDQTSGAYRSTRESHARWSPFAAQVTRALAGRLLLIGSGPLGYLFWASVHIQAPPPSAVLRIPPPSMVDAASVIVGTRRYGIVTALMPRSVRHDKNPAWPAGQGAGGTLGAAHYGPQGPAGG